MTRALVVATMNMQSEAPPAQALAGLDDVLSVADVVCLQEWKADRDRLLKQTGFLSTGKVRKPPSTGWAFLRGKPAGGTVVAFRGSLIEAVSSKSVVLAKGRRVIPVPGRRSELGNTRATEAIGIIRATGQRLVVYSFHLPSHVQAGRGKWLVGPRTDMHHEAVKTLMALAAKAKAAGALVVEAGDTNVDEFDMPGLISCWAGRKPLPTHGARTIDTVYALGQAATVVTLKNASDHKAVVATYSQP